MTSATHSSFSPKLMEHMVLFREHSERFFLAHKRSIALRRCTRRFPPTLRERCEDGTRGLYLVRTPKCAT